jgi:GT2 family glycosyltransferase
MFKRKNAASASDGGSAATGTTAASHDGEAAARARVDAAPIAPPEAWCWFPARASDRSRANGFEGFVEGLVGPRVEGWVFDASTPGRVIEVALFDGDQALATVRADRFRGDLQAAGKGDGACGFALAIPFDRVRGPGRALDVRVLDGGWTLPLLEDRPLVIPATAPVGAGFEGLHGGALRGWLAAGEGLGPDEALDLLVDGEHAHRFTPRAAGDGRLAFDVRLPDRWHDGRPHEFTLARADRPGPPLARMVAISPVCLTPFDALQRYAGLQWLKGYHSPLGPWRYESLRRGLRQRIDELPAATDADPAALARALDDLRALVDGHEQNVQGGIERWAGPATMAFPAVASPRATVVIPVHGKLDVTLNCLASLRAAANAASFEVVIVDDGSLDETRDIESRVAGVRVVRHAVATGFVGACNDGAAVARGDYVVLLNNDTEVATGWLDALLEPFDRFDRVGLVGAKLVYPDGSLQEAGGIVWGNGDVWNLGRGGNPSEPRFNYLRQVDYVSGACLAVPRALWRELDGLDAEFAPAYYEDTDLAFRVRAAGHRTLYTPFCEVVHFEGLSNGTSTQGSGLKRYQALHEPRFRARWAGAYRTHALPGREPVHLAQDRHVELRALMLDARTLTPDQDAGSHAALQEIRLLQSLGFKVTFVPANVAYMGRYTEDLQRRGVEVAYAPFVQSLAEFIDTRGPEFDLVWIARYGVAAPVIERLRQRAPQARIVLNLHDLHFLREMREAVAHGSRDAMTHALATRDAELDVLRRVDLALSYSEVEQAVVLSHNLDSTRMATCPWVVDDVAPGPAFEARAGIAFLGGFEHRPNVEAMTWFVAEVMPLLRRTGLGITLRIHGSKVPDAIRALAAPDVVIEGWTRELREVFDRSRVFVAPLLTGAGLKGKVVSALAHGVPVVMSPIAAEGMGAGAGTEALIPVTPADWVQAIVSLHEDPARWAAFSAAGRALAARQYGFEPARARLRTILQQVGLYTATDGRALCSR